MKRHIMKTLKCWQKRAVVFLVGLALSLGSCKKPPHIGGNTNIDVISFNIRYDNWNDGANRWDNRKEACVRLLKAREVSVFGIQEGLYHQVDYLANNLPDYDYVGVGRDDGQTDGEYCAVFYLKNNFELLNSSTFWLSETPEMPSLGWDANIKRIVTWVHLKEKQTDKEIYVFNTHFDHKGAQARKHSARLLAQKISEITSSNETVFITGDFNAILIDPIFAPILKHHFNAKAHAYITENVGSLNAWGAWSANIDFIFYRNADVYAYDVVNEDFGVPYVSDHYPIMAKFKI